MDLSELIRSLPPDVAVVALGGPVAGAEIFQEEERALPATAVAVRVAEFRLGRLAAHRALRKVGIEPRPILRGERGEPLWPRGVVGSITHSGGHAIAMVARSETAGRIGIDLEKRDRYFDDLEAQIARPEELAALARLPGPARELAALEIFSAKETIYKAHFPLVRRFFGFEMARIEFAAGHLVGYFSEEIDPLYPMDRPMHIGRLWIDDTLLTWMVLPPE
jgi:4'-phosphopantetheinyl transferase EntD